MMDMTLFGMAIETIYLILLIVSGSLTILSLFFGYVLVGVGEATVFLKPVLILSFITLLSAAGFIFEKATTLNSFLMMVIAAILSAFLEVQLNVFGLVPMKPADQTG